MEALTEQHLYSLCGVIAVGVNAACGGTCGAKVRGISLLKFFRVMLGVLLLLGTVTFASAGQAVTATTLPSGMKVIVREGHEISLVTVDVWVRAGSVNETAETHGMSHMVEHMLFKATKRFGPGQFDRELEGVGAELNGGTSRDWVHFFTTVASKDLPTALDLIGDALSNPEFRQEDLDRERQVVLDEIARSESDPARRALDAFYETAFKVHPYRYPPVGVRKSVAALTRDDLVRYYGARFVPSNTCVAIAGDTTNTEAARLVTAAFAGYGRAGKQADVSIALEPAITSPRATRVVSPGKQAYLVVGYLTAPASALVEACSLDTMANVLGDTRGGRLASALSAAGVKYTKIDSNYINQRYPAPFTVTVGVDPAQTDAAVSAVLGEFARLGREPVSAGEMARARQRVVGADLFQQETFSGQARALGMCESISSYSLATKYGATASQITASDVMFTAAKYFGPANYCLAVVSPEVRQ